MSGLQKELNESRPFGNVFAGSGDQTPEDRAVRYQQHGLYFGPDKKLATLDGETHPYNKEKIALFNALGINTDEPKPEVIEPTRQPVNPEVTAELEGKTDAELYEMAVKLTGLLAQNGTPSDYEPVEADRDGMVAFIAQHAS